MGKSHSWTAKQIEFLRANKNKPTKWLAAQLGIPTSKISDAKNRYGLTTKKLVYEQKDRLLRPLYEKGMTDCQMSTRLYIGVSAIVAWRVQSGLKANKLKPGEKRKVKYKSPARINKHKLAKKEYNEREYGRKGNKWKSGYIYYTDEETAWLTAILKWRTEHGRPPTLVEAFRLALAMGYRKVGDENGS